MRERSRELESDLCHPSALGNEMSASDMKTKVLNLQIKDISFLEHKRRIWMTIKCNVKRKSIVAKMRTNMEDELQYSSCSPSQSQFQPYLPQCLPPSLLWSVSPSFLLILSSLILLSNLLKTVKLSLKNTAANSACKVERYQGDKDLKPFTQHQSYSSVHGCGSRVSTPH